MGFSVVLGWSRVVLSQVFCLVRLPHSPIIMSFYCLQSLAFPGCWLLNFTSGMTEQNKNPGTDYCVAPWVLRFLANLPFFLMVMLFVTSRYLNYA